MTLSDIQIFYMTPKRNCKECGCSSCMDFAKSVASGDFEVSKCKYLSAEVLAKIAAAVPVKQKGLASDKAETLINKFKILREKNRSYEQEMTEFQKAEEDKRREQQEMKERNQLSPGFFPETISVDTSRIFPVMVLATMSSGKSTLVNALLGTEILPSKNAACTAKVYSILDDDSVCTPSLYLTFKNGDTEVIHENLAEALQNANENDEVENIFISGQVKGVLNTDKALLLIDTPGPNNSQDASHGKLMRETIKKLRGGLILYIINATQMGIKDDYNNLLTIWNHVKENPDVKVLFLMNKTDEIDTEKESIQEFVQETAQYIKEIGFSSPEILPISALAANLFKRVLAGKELTRKQERDFLQCYDMFKTSDIRLTSYAVTKELGNQNEKRSVGNKQYTVADIMAALENTGILYLEKYIQREQILSSQNGDLNKILKKFSQFQESAKDKEKVSQDDKQPEEQSFFVSAYEGQWKIHVY